MIDLAEEVTITCVSEETNVHVVNSGDKPNGVPDQSRNEVWIIHNPIEQKRQYHVQKNQQGEKCIQVDVEAITPFHILILGSPKIFI